MLQLGALQTKIETFHMGPGKCRSLWAPTVHPGKSIDDASGHLRVTEGESELNGVDLRSTSVGNQLSDTG